MKVVIGNESTEIDWHVATLILVKLAGKVMVTVSLVLTCNIQSNTGCEL